MLALCFLTCNEVVAQTRDAAETSEASAFGQDRSRGRVSKFEARRMRHACRDQAQRSGVGANGRSAFVSACVRLHIVARHFWGECKRLAAGRGLDKTAAEDFTRACVSEKMRQKAGTEHRD
jgi:hypothetical protein